MRRRLVDIGMALTLTGLMLGDAELIVWFADGAALWEQMAIGAAGLIGFGCLTPAVLLTADAIEEALGWT